MKFKGDAKGGEIMRYVITPTGEVLADREAISERYSPLLADLVLGVLGPQNEDKGDGVLVKDPIRDEELRREE